MPNMPPVDFLGTTATVKLTDVNLTTEQIRDKIAQLELTDEGESLRGAMDSLKLALKQNPAACAAMLPEDIGAMVKHLIRLTGKDIEDTMAAKGKKKAPPKIDIANLTEAQIKEVENDLF